MKTSDIPRDSWHGGGHGKAASRFLAILLALWLGGAAAPKKPQAPQPSAPAAPAAPARIVAIGDLHGDLAAAERALRLAGAIDAQGRWAGQDMTVVQTGDQINRGDQDRLVLDLFERLRGEAASAGGAVVSLNGNHEILNVVGDLDDVTGPSLRAFEGIAGLKLADPRITSFAPEQRARAAAFMPGGPYAQILGERPVVTRIGDTVFVHGGVLPQHLSYGLERLNQETRAWLRGEAAQPPELLLAPDGPVWSRAYSKKTGRKACALAQETLQRMGAARMVVGHTPQDKGISHACDRRVWRIDVGLSSYYQGPTQVLEISGDRVQVLQR